MMAWALAVLLAIATPADAARIDDERAVTTAALVAYFNLMHGGTGVAFPEHRRPVLLHRTTISPSRDQLRVRVSSSVNGTATVLYAEPAAQKLVESLLRRSAGERTMRAAPAGFAAWGEARRTGCGPEYDSRRFTDAIAVSRPGFDGRRTALIYLELPGGASAYHATRVDGAWKVDWYVELWACG